MRKSPPTHELRIRRQQLGLSQRNLAARIGVSHTLVARVERGATGPGNRTTRKVTALLLRLDEEGRAP